MTQQPARICILGGGFGGLYTALRLGQFTWESTQKPEIILVDQRDRFLFSPLLYELITGEMQAWEVAPPFIDLLANTGVKFHQGIVTGLDLDTKQVQLQDGSTLKCDRLVLALGGETPMTMADGVADHALTFRTLEDAYRLEARLQELKASDAEKIRIALVGGGYTGVELACKLADRLGARGRIRLVESSDQILRFSPDFNREAAQQALEARGIWLDLETTVESVSADSLSLLFRGQVDTIPVDLVLWTVGLQVHPVIQGLPLKHNLRGQVMALPTLQVVDYPDVFALGDVADCKDAEGRQVPNSAQGALQQADFAAWNLWASLVGRSLLPFRYQHLGEFMTLGAENATFTGMGLKFDGTLAFLFRRLSYLYRMPTLDHQIRVGMNWITEPITQFLSALGQTSP